MKDALSLRQCEANILAGFAYYGLPRLQTVATMADRCLFALDLDFLDRLNDMVPREFEWWPFVHNHGLTAIAGWRERVAWCSMQIVQHTGPAELVEVDFDLCNPDFGLAPAIGHLVEILWPGKTDPFRVAAGLRRRGVDVPDMRKIT